MFVEAGVSLGRSSHRRSGAYSLLVAKPCLPQRSDEEAAQDGPRLKALLPAGLRVVPIGKWDTGRGFIQPLSQRCDQRAESGIVVSQRCRPQLPVELRVVFSAVQWEAVLVELCLVVRQLGVLY